MRISPIGDFGAAPVFALAAASIGPSEAAVLHPWCASGTGEESGGLSCSYDTYEQCVANVGICQANPAVQPLPGLNGSTRAMQARMRTCSQPASTDAARTPPARLVRNSRDDMSG
jgi:Protein of unknown function (DUF3551)